MITKEQLDELERLFQKWISGGTVATINERQLELSAAFLQHGCALIAAARECESLRKMEEGLLKKSTELAQENHGLRLLVLTHDAEIEKMKGGGRLLAEAAMALGDEIKGLKSENEKLRTDLLELMKANAGLGTQSVDALVKCDELTAEYEEKIDYYETLIEQRTKRLEGEIAALKHRIAQLESSDLAQEPPVPIAPMKMSPWDKRNES